MAKVQVQVVVDRKQVDQLSSDLDKLNGKKITIGSQQFTSDLKEANHALSETNDKLVQTVRIFDENGNLVQGVDKLKRGTATTVQNTHKLNEETGKLELTRQKFTTNIEKEEKAQKSATEATKEANKEVKQQGLLYDILGRSVSSFLARMVAYRAVYAGIRAVTNGFKEALETLKAVDTELVTVRKVTGFDQWQMAGVEEQAYSVASKYGTSAADYTSSVAAFARAGYKELSGDLAELAEKTKIVGDTTADVAQQFLLSVDAAYKYKGNIEALTAVLDGANEIDNKFATSIEKIAEGMGIVAPVAAQMHVGVDELAASIGTITAVTQRTGTEAARALRAIYLNIVGDTKTEIEEGVTWTTGEIEGLRDVIKLYAKDAYDAAQASGGIIDPMEAIAGLAKSVKDGVLTEAKLMEMVSDIGGKLRTSQLLAIVNNWDMYEQMLETYRNSAGSAEKEIENAMDSWTRKTEVLKNTWTQFVKTGLNSSAFKGALDALTWFIERLGTLPGLLTRLIPLFAALKLRDMAKHMNESAKAANAMADGMKAAGTAAKTLNWISAILAVISAVWNGISIAIENAKIKHKELVQEIYEEATASKESADNLMTLYADFYTAKEGSDEFTESIKKLADALGVDVPAATENAVESLRKLSRENLVNSLNDINEAVVNARDDLLASAHEAGRGSNLTMYRRPDENLFSGNAQLEQMWQSLYGNQRFFKADELAGEGFLDFSPTNEADIRAFREELEKIVEKTQELARTTENGGDLLKTGQYLAAKQYLSDTAEALETLNGKLSDYDSVQTQIKWLDMLATTTVDSADAYDHLIQKINLENRSSDEQREALIALAEIYYPQYANATEDAANAVDDLSDSVEAENEGLFKNQKALEADATATDKAAAAKKDAEAAVSKFCDALFDETGELTEAGKAALKASDYLADLTQAELNARLEAAKANYANLRAQLAGVSADALKAAYALIALESAATVNGIIENREGRDMRDLERTVGYIRTLINQINALEAEINSVSVQATHVEPYTSGYSSGSSSSGSSGGSHSSSSTSTEDEKLKSLQERVTLLKSELSLMKERGDSEADQIAKMRQIQNALKAEWEYLQSIKGDQATINGLMQDWWSIENSVTSMMDEQAKSAQAEADALQKALEAQLALNNALKNRSVRYYNASTGQWEWGANQQNVQSAYSAYQSAVAGAPSEYQGALIRQGVAMTGYGIRGSFSDFMSRLRGGGAGNTNNYGSTYNLGGISLTDAQAQGMSVYDLAMLSGRLAAFS